MAITDGMAKGSTMLTISDTSAFKPGQIIQISELNDTSLPVAVVSGFERMRRQKTAIVAKTETTISIFPPLYWTLKRDLSPQIVAAADQANGVGIENLRINGKEKQGRLIDLWQCYGCWITVFRNWFHGTCDTSEPKTNQFGRCISLNRFARNFSLVGNILGRTGLTYIYDNADGGTGYRDRYIYNLGLPNMGNGGFKGMAPPWKDPLNSKTINASGYQELDRDVAKTTIRRGNWNAKDAGVPASESLGDEAIPKSLFRSSKPEWFGKLAWPPFDPSQPNQSYDAIPAGYRFKHKTDP